MAGERHRPPWCISPCEAIEAQKSRTCLDFSFVTPPSAACNWTFGKIQIQVLYNLLYFGASHVPLLCSTLCLSFFPPSRSRPECTYSDPTQYGRLHSAEHGALGFAMLLALLFYMPSDIGSVLSSNIYCPFMNIYAYAVGSNTGATAMVSRLMDQRKSTALNSILSLLRATSQG